MFCWLLAIFLLGLALGLSDGGKLARLVTFLTPEEAGVDPDDPGVDPADEVWPWRLLEVVGVPVGLGETAAAAAAAAATLFRLRCT